MNRTKPLTKHFIDGERLSAQTMSILYRLNRTTDSVSIARWIGGIKFLHALASHSHLSSHISLTCNPHHIIRGCGRESAILLYKNLCRKKTASAQIFFVDHRCKVLTGKWSACSNNCRGSLPSNDIPMRSLIAASSSNPRFNSPPPEMSKPNDAHCYSKEHAVCTRVSHSLFIISFCIRCVPPCSEM
jgi:hypothetical protein